MSGALKDRIALVTGASRGIGYHAAMGFAQAGAHVVALARTVGGLEELDDAICNAGGSATLVPLDITDFDALDRLGASLHERWGRLDILLGNAGTLGVATPLAQLKPTVFDETFSINVTANYRLLRSLDPLLQASDAGRALFVTSAASRVPRPFIGPYGASKAALDMLVRAYAAENRLSGVCANLIDPGALRTRMRAGYAPGEDPQTVTPPQDIVPTLVDLVSTKTEDNGRLYSFTERRWLD